MGMDLIGARLSYNWTGWHLLIERLEDWGVDTSELSTYNDGDPISAKTCHAIADALENHLHELSVEDQLWEMPRILAWRRCNGCLQF